MALEQLSYGTVDTTLQVPFYRLRKRFAVPPATADRPNGAIEEAIAKSPSFFTAGHHYLKLVNGAIPHVPPKRIHYTGWFSTVETGVDSWGPDNIRALAKDSVFLDALSQKISEIQQANPRLNVYTFMGFQIPGTSQPHEMFRSLQSIQRNHIHFAEEFPPSFTPSRYLSPLVASDAERIMSFLDFGGTMSQEMFSRRLSSFGTHHLTTQMVGHLDADPPMLSMERLFCGFRSFAEAIGQSIDLRESLEEEWPRHTLFVADHMARVGEINVALRAAPVPQTTIIFPSLDLRDRWGVSDEFPVFVHPLGAIGVPQITAYGGSMLEWDPAPSEQKTLPYEKWMKDHIANGNGNGNGNGHG
jgi:hypothetical protein